MQDNSLYSAISCSLLNCRRLPARLNAEQCAAVIGVQVHDIPTLVRRGLLHPLGQVTANAVKYFSSAEIQELSKNRRWLDKVTKALRRPTQVTKAGAPNSKWPGPAQALREARGRCPSVTARQEPAVAGA